MMVCSEVQMLRLVLRPLPGDHQSPGLCVHSYTILVPRPGGRICVAQDLKYRCRLDLSK